jgi:MFS family permease
MIGGLMFAHGIALALFNFPGGALSDRFGRKWPPFWGSMVATIGILWYSFPNGYWPLLVAVALAGAGAAAATPGLAAMVGDISSPSRRGEAFGFFQTSFHLGMVFGAFVFGFLADLIGLRFSVFSWGVFSLVLSSGGLLIKGAVARPPASTPE